MATSIGSTSDYSASSYDDLAQAYMNATGSNEVQTTTDANGNVYVTNDMTPQQSYATSLQGNPNAESILSGMGLDINGNPVDDFYASVYSNNYNGTSAGTSSGSSSNYGTSYSGTEYSGSGDTYTLSPTSSSGTTVVGSSYTPTTYSSSAGSNASSLYSSYLSALQAASDPTSSYWDTYRTQAQSTAAQEVADKQAQLDSGKAALDDQYFQKYLSSRQGIANRGLAGSGLSNDANYRLSLAKQGAVSDLYNSLGTFNETQLASDEFQKLYDSYSSKLMDQANSLATMYSTSLNNQYNYDALNANTAYNYYNTATQAATSKYNTDTQAATSKYNTDTQAATSKYNTDTDAATAAAQLAENARQFNAKLTSDQQTALAELGFKYDQLDQQDRQFYDSLNSDNAYKAAQIQIALKQYDLDVTKVMGQDENGNLTLDAKEFIENVALKKQELANQSAQINASISQGWARIALDNKEYELKVESVKNEAQSLINEATSAKTKTQLEVLKDTINTSSSQLNSIRTKLDSKDLDDSQKSALMADYKNNVAKIEAAQEYMQKITQLKKESTSASYDFVDSTHGAGSTMYSGYR